MESKNTIDKEESSEESSSSQEIGDEDMVMEVDMLKIMMEENKKIKKNH